MSRGYLFEPLAFRCQPGQRFEEFLQSRGKRVTQQRQIIVQVIFGRRVSFDDDQLLAQLAEEIADRKIGRATVYRTLSELVEAGLLRQEPSS